MQAYCRFHPAGSKASPPGRFSFLYERSVQTSMDPRARTVTLYRLSGVGL